MEPTGYSDEECAFRSDYLAILHVNDTVGLGGEFVVMGHDHEGGLACLVQGTHQSKQPFSAVCVEVPRRLIGQDQVRILHQRARHRDALLLAAGEFSRLVMEAVPQSDFREQNGCVGLDRSGITTLYERRHAGIFQRGELGKQVMELKYEPYPPIPEFRLLCIRHSKEIVPIERDGASGRFIKGSDNMEQGAFAGSRSSHDRHQLAAVNLKVNPLEDGQFVGPHREGFMEVGDFNHGTTVIRSSSPSRFV